MRDFGKTCVSCGSPKTAHASHFYCVKQYPTLRFNENNVHASCVYCNKFLEGNLHEYRNRIVERIGYDGLDKLDDLADLSKQKNHKWQRFEVIELLEKYRELAKKQENILKSQ